MQSKITTPITSLIITITVRVGTINLDCSSRFELFEIILIQEFIRLTNDLHGVARDVR